MEAKITYVVLMALLGVVIAVGVITDSYGVPPWPHWSGMTEDDQIILIACPCAGALIGALFGCFLMATPNTIAEQASTSESERLRSSSIGTTHSRVPKSMSKLMRCFPYYLNMHQWRY